MDQHSLAQLCIHNHLPVVFEEVVLIVRSWYADVDEETLSDDEYFFFRNEKTEVELDSVRDVALAAAADSPSVF